MRVKSRVFDLDAKSNLVPGTPLKYAGKQIGEVIGVVEFDGYCELIADISDPDLIEYLLKHGGQPPPHMMG